MTTLTGKLSMRIRKRNKYAIIFIFCLLLVTLQLCHFDGKALKSYYKFFYRGQRNLTPGYVTKFSDVCEVEKKNINIPFVNFFKRETREISVNLGNGECEWKQGVPLNDTEHIHGVLLASYPAAGMRLTWQHVEGLTGHEVQDDFEECDGKHQAFGIVKTQYPHLEGIWSWGSNLKEVIYVMRNPRWAIPSYHTLLHEIDYAHDCESAKEMLENVFTFRPPMWKWTRWRDLRFKDEIKLYEWHIDFWMENGTTYWQDWDYERNGQWPFRWLNKEEKEVFEKDLNCQYQGIDCVPKVVVSYEHLQDEFKGPKETRKMAEVFENKTGLLVIEEEARECVWHATTNEPRNRNNVDRAGSSNGEYGFTYSQMETIQEMLVRVQTKYSTDPWIGNNVAQDIVEYVTYYIALNDEEMNAMIGNFPPTPSPNPEYMQGLKTWYKSIGRGDRYSKANVQNMYGFWKYNSHLYDSGAPSIAPSIS